MTTPPDISTQSLTGSIRSSFKYKRLIINSTLLPLWVRILPGNEIRLEIKIDSAEKAQSLVTLLHKWFEDLTIKEIQHEEDIR